MKQLSIAIGLAVILSAAVQVNAEENLDPLSIDEQRERDLTKIKIEIWPDLKKIEAKAVEIFAEPVDEQDSNTLKNLAMQANYVANLISHIKSEYDDYYRDNYRYDFVQTKVDKSRDGYAGIADIFLEIRNQAYYNLGILHQAKGDKITAYFYYRDAFRLSYFPCPNGTKSCMRWKAEQKMKELLGIQIESYVYWK